MSRTNVTLQTALLLGLAVSLANCGDCGKKKSSSSKAAPNKAAEEKREALEAALPSGLAVRLSDGSPGGGAADRLPAAKAAKLGDSESAALLERVPALEGKAEDKKDFALRDRSLPPPLTGETIEGAFPPPPTKAAPPAASGEGEALEVLRFAPEGDVPLVPHLSVTFSQPMIAVTSHADSVAKGVPVKLTPQPKGQWRWVGTRTLLFDPDPRFPQATEYRVEIPAGTKSATGGVLAEAKSWTFTTPAPQLQQSLPNDGPHPLEPVMFAAFDQDIDPQAVLSTIEVKAGNLAVQIRAATETEIELDKLARPAVEVAKQSETPKRYVAFRALRPLPPDTHVVVTIGPGTPSAEGPRKTESAQSFSFRTYGPLKIEDYRCSWGRDCPPLTPWYIEMTNPLDDEVFDPTAIRIEPELAGMSARVQGDYIYIRGLSKGRTRYTVTLPPTLEDVFGQTLGKAESVTFHVGSADPRLWGPTGLVVLDPVAKKPTFDVFSINHKALKVRLYQVEPSDWEAFTQYMREYNRSDDKIEPPGNKVVDTVVQTGGEPDEMTETAIDLAPALKNGLGHVIAVVEPAVVPKNQYKPILQAWVQATKIGLDAFVDNTDLFAWATSLADGKPLPGVKLEIAPYGVTGDTDDKGMATLALANDGAKGSNLLLAKKDGDVAMLPENLYWWSDHGGWYRRDPGQSLRWFVFDDRQMYKPGEEVHVKGWVRRVDNREGGDISAVGAEGKISYRVLGSRGNELLKGTAELSALGGFDTAFKLPDTANLGYARLELSASVAGIRSGYSHRHTFRIQEFRRPEFEVSATATEGPHLVGGHADVTVKASYYAGGGLPNADVTWTVTSAQGSFTPPNRDDYTFGTWVPWWRHQNQGNTGPTHATLAAKTDSTGSHVLHIEFLSVKPPRPMSVTAQASVMDVNRQAWAASATMLVHPSDLYVGLKSDRLFLEQGKPIEIESIVVDHDGKAVAGRNVTIRAVREEWVYEKGDWVTKERDPQYCNKKSTDDPSKCTFGTKLGGTYKVTASVVDDKDRRNESQLTIWVSGGKQRPARNVELEEVQLVPDKKEYRPGDTAEILVMAPFSPAQGLLTVRRSGIVTTERFEMAKTSKTLTVKIEEGHIPNVYVQVDLVGAAARLDAQGKPAAALPKRPAFAKGSLNLSVPPLSRTLSLDVVPADRKIEPGGSTSVDVKVRDAAGKPVAGAELAVVVVDEAILALTGYATPDPIPSFYSQRGPGARDHHSRSQVTLARPEADALSADDTGVEQKALEEGDNMMMDKRAVGGAMPPPAPAAETPAMSKSMAKKKAPGGGKDAAPQPIAVRKDFNALAVFAPEVHTDQGGSAHVEVKVPDNLTRYRVMVVAVSDGKFFGKGESSITARMPLMVRPSPPRFLNFGDRFELPIVLQNQTDDPMQVRIALRSYNVALTDGNGRKVDVPANDRVEVRFPAAAELAGTARFQIAAAAGDWADAAEVALPVWTPATTEAFATYGEIDDGAIKQPVALPGGVVEQFGGLEITTSSTQLQALTDAFLYLVSYPFECAEQLSSRVLAVAALRDVLSAFKADGLPPTAEIEAAVARDLKRLRGLQNYDGGFAFWRRGDESWPYVSIHVAHALARAESKGFAVAQQMHDQSLSYLREIESHIPHWYPIEVRRTLIAYALYVRKLMGDTDTVRARGLIAEAGLEKLSMEAIGWLLSVLAGDAASQQQRAAIYRFVTNRVSETAATANFTTSYSDGANLILHSDRRVDGIMLEALILDKPKSDLIPKVVRGLLAHRKRGRWGNTQENAFVLLALDKYFHEYEKVTPNFVARAWLGEQFAGEHRFRGRTTERQHIDIPMRYVAAAKSADLVLAKQGKGRLYYRIGMTYAPADLKLDPADHGFAVERKYEAVDDPADVNRDADGVWHVRAGARVRVRLTMVAVNRRYHVALVDPLPAGLEPMNPALAVTGTIPQDPQGQKSGGRYWWWSRTWYEHQNMRDERVEAFTSLLWEGVHEYTYVARATTPGNFVVPPPKAEEMYHPETFGRGGSDRLIVE